MAEVVAVRAAIAACAGRLLLHVLAALAQADDADVAERVAVVVELTAARVDVDEPDRPVDEFVEHYLVPGRELRHRHSQVALDRVRRRPRPHVRRPVREQVARLGREAEHRQHAELGEPLGQVRVLVVVRGDGVHLVEQPGERAVAESVGAAVGAGMSEQGARERDEVRALVGERDRDASAPVPVLLPALDRTEVPVHGDAAVELGVRGGDRVEADAERLGAQHPLDDFLLVGGQVRCWRRLGGDAARIPKVVLVVREVARDR